MSAPEPDELEFLTAASRILGASLDYATTLGQVAELAVPALADHCALYVMEPDGRVRQVGDATVDPATTRALRARRGTPLAPDRAGVVGQVILSGRGARLAPPYAAAEDGDRGTAIGAMAAAKPESIAVLPLRARGSVLGAIVLGVSPERPWTERTARLADDIADRAALALDNAWLYREARVAASRLATLAEASRVFAEAGLEPRAAFEAIVRFVSELLGDGCVLLLASSDGVELGLAAVHHPDAATRALLRDVFEPPFRADEGLPGMVYSGGEPLLLTSVKPGDVPAGARPSTHRYFLQARPHSLLFVPLRHGDRIIGALGVSRERPGPPYGEHEARLLLDLADRAALHVESARLYREAQDANRVKDEFLGTVSHELRTPLTSILGWVWMLRTGRVDAAGLTRAVATIERNAQAQARLIDDLLDVSRIVAGKLQLQLQRADLGALVSSAVETVRPMAESRGLVLRAAIERVEVRGDPQRLQQVALNLLSNAVKFTPEGGAIDVTVARSPDDDARAELVVKDTGRGIPLDFLPHVFDRFRQADSSATRAHGGLGLGLAIARHIVELHAGSIRAESPGPGLGATMIVTLPATAGLRRTATPRTAEPGAVGGTRALEGVRVLVVDDEADTREVLLAALACEGATVIGASNARDALERVRSHRPDVMVSDIGMPGEDGYALVRSIRALPEPAVAGMLVVALTAYARPEDAARAKEAGFDEHVAKPIEPGRLAGRIAQGLEQRGKRAGR